MRGRKPTPTKLKIINNVRASRINQNEPAADGMPKCPAHLSKPAKAEWKRIVVELSKLGILASVDRAVLASYCQSWADWVEAEEKLRGEGPVMYGDKGAYQNPWRSIANRAKLDMHKAAAEFGMTPSSRSRVHAAPQSKEVDEFEAGLGMAN